MQPFFIPFFSLKLKYDFASNSLFKPFNLSFQMAKLTNRISIYRLWTMDFQLWSWFYSYLRDSIGSNLLAL